MQDEFYVIAFRKKGYATLEELQEDLDLWLEHYNKERTHTGKYCFGRTPYQTLLETIPLAKRKCSTALDKILSNIFFRNQPLHTKTKGWGRKKNEPNSVGSWNNALMKMAFN